LLLQKEEFDENQLANFKIADIALWNKYNRNVRILPDSGTQRDTVFNKTYYDKLENEQEPYRELNSPIVIDGRNYTYQGRINLIEKRDLVVSTASLFLIIIIILLAGILIITKISSTRLWKPFFDTLKQIQEFEIDKNSKPNFTTTNIEEFSRLNKSLERLIERNTDIYNSQREFVENAAHELQTPLALFQAKIDTLLQLDLSKDQAALVGALNNDVTRLNRLNKNLLLLSKIEQQNFLDRQPIILNDYIKKHLEFFVEQSKSKNLSVLTEFTKILKVDANPALVEILINNLFLNAIRHNVKGGRIVISLADKKLSFLNTGQETSLSTEKIFNRFSKSNPSSQGNGLGLSIVKKIADLNNWKITYSFYNNLHEFTIRF
jgi:signal transduction histidine kinase